MKWFGEHWGAVICDEVEHVEVPIGAQCAGCGSRVREDDDGVLVPGAEGRGPGIPREHAYHLRCFRAALGVDR